MADMDGMKDAKEFYVDTPQKIFGDGYLGTLLIKYTNRNINGK